MKQARCLKFWDSWVSPEKGTGPSHLGISILWTQWDKEERGPSRTQEAEKWWDWGIPITPISRSSPVPFDPIQSSRCLLPGSPIFTLPSSHLILFISQRNLCQKKPGMPPSCSKPSQGLATAPDGDQAPHSSPGRGSGLYPPVHPHLPLLLTINQFSEN